MGRTLSISDDDLGAAVSVRVEQRAGQPVVTRLLFEEMGDGGLSSAALSLLGDLGLNLPEQPQRRPAVKKAPAKKPAAKKTPARKARPAPAAAAEPAEPADDVLALPAADNQPPRPPAPLRAQGAAPAQRTGRRTGPPPGVDELRESFRRHRGNIGEMATEFGSSNSSVANWLRRAREGGAQITLAGLEEQASS